MEFKFQLRLLHSFCLMPFELIFFSSHLWLKGWQIGIQTSCQHIINYCVSVKSVTSRIWQTRENNRSLILLYCSVVFSFVMENLSNISVSSLVLFSFSIMMFPSFNFIHLLSFCFFYLFVPPCHIFDHCTSLINSFLFCFLAFISDVFI